MIAGGRGGAIVNTAPVAGLSGGAGPQAYSAAKAAVVNLTRATAVELGQHRIRVNAICPGAILTPLLGTSQGPDLVERLDRLQPWPEHGVGDDIAGAALSLASDDARFVTGEALVGFWVVSRDAEALGVMRDAATFSSGAGGTAIDDSHAAGITLNQSDDPQHSRLRSLVNRVRAAHHRRPRGRPAPPRPRHRRRRAGGSPVRLRAGGHPGAAAAGHLQHRRGAPGRRRRS
ncbi:MAG: SDR family oxidoreductase [Acidimicrobiales bacterium]|nr:SDR family oxidoreductase [Acidimicrobiales bacterium]